MEGCVFMNTHYIKRKLCKNICLNGKSTIKTAQEYNIPLKTLEKWITAFNKDNHCFDPKLENSDFKKIDSLISKVSYDDMFNEELKQQLMKKDIL